MESRDISRVERRLRVLSTASVDQEQLGRDYGAERRRSDEEDSVVRGDSVSDEDGPKGFANTNGSRFRVSLRCQSRVGSGANVMNRLDGIDLIHRKIIPTTTNNLLHPYHQRRHQLRYHLIPRPNNPRTHTHHVPASARRCSSKSWKNPFDRCQTTNCHPIEDSTGSCTGCRTKKLPRER